MSQEIIGKFFDGVFAKPNAATLTRQGDRVLVSWESETREYSIKELHFEEQIVGGERRISFATGEQFQTTNDYAVDSTFSDLIGGNWLYKMEKKWRYTLGGLVAGAIVVSFLILVGVESLSLAFAPFLPKWLLTFATEEVKKELKIDLNVILKAEDLDRFNEASSRFEKQTGFKVTLVRSHFGANAMALPNDEILMTNDLVEKLKTSDQVLAVLLHEAGHVRHQHVRRMIVRWLVTAGFVSVLGNNKVGHFGYQLFQLQNSREAELEADSYAAEQLKVAGLSPAILAEALEAISLQNETVLPAFMSTHPHVQDRAKKLRGKQ